MEKNERQKEEDYSEDFEEASHSEEVTNIFSEDEVKSTEENRGRSHHLDDLIVSRELSRIRKGKGHYHQPQNDKPRQNPSSQGQLDQGVPDELRGLTHYFEGGDGDVSEDVSVSTSHHTHSQPQPQHSQPESRRDSISDSRGSRTDRQEAKSDESSIENILDKLHRLTNAQLALENVLDAEGNMDDGTLEKALENARLHIPAFASKQNQDDEALSLSLGAEMDALQKLTRGKQGYKYDETVDEERDIHQIFKQYDHIEKLYDKSTGSCDEQESIRSETSDAPLRSRVSSKNPDPNVTQPQRKQQQINYGPFRTQPSSSSTPITPHHSNRGSSKALPVSFVPLPLPDSIMRHQALGIELSASNSSSNLSHVSSSSSLTMTDGLVGVGPTPKDGIFQTPRSQKSYYRTDTRSMSGGSGNSKYEETSPASPPKAIPSYVKESVSAPGLGRDRDDRPITPSSPNLSRNSRTIASPRRRNKGGNEQIRSSGNEGRGEGLHLQEQNLLKIQKLEQDIVKQESLIDAFQQDNQKLYNELKANEKNQSKKEAEWEEITNSLKTEVATLKINRLAPLANSPARPGSAQRAELDRIREESGIKTQQIIELRKEIILMRNSMAEKAKPAKQGRAALISQEREKESQKTIRGLTKQVRTLQKILYRRDPTAASALARASSRDDLNLSQERLSTANGDGNDAHVTVLETRIIELERELSKADEEARSRLKDFQARLTGLKGKYEDQIKDYEMRMEEAAGMIESLESNVAQSTIEEFKARYDKSQSEISHLKQEINRYKREVEIAQKSSVSTAVSQATAKQDAGTLSLAIKSFKSELSEKEKEIIRMKKELADLNRTNTTLKRERERYLNLANALTLPGSFPNNPRIVSRTTSELNQQGLKPTKEKPIVHSKSRSPTRPPGNANLATTQMLQSALEYERTEFQQMIDQQKKELQERDQIIVKLKRELEDVKDGKADEVEDSRKSHMLNELRSRVTTQNDLIHKLKDHIANYRRIEGEYLLLKQENGQAEIQIKDLKQKLQIAKELNKPENEILEFLSMKFEELNSRYASREGEMLKLLHRLSIRNGSDYLTPRMVISSGSNLDRATRLSELDLRQLSPTLSMHLLNASSDTQEV